MTGSPAKRRPKLSIILATYNRSAMLAQCLERVTQTTVDCEILLFDDASTDDTERVGREYAGRDARVKYVRNPTNLGGTGNFLAGHAAAHGDYIADLGDDDWPMPGNYEKKIAILDAHPEVGMVYSFRGMVDFRTNQVSYPRRGEQLTYSYIGGRNEFLDLLSGNYIPAATVVWRRRLTEEFGLWDLERVPPTLVDWDLWLRYSYHAATAYIAEPLMLAGFGHTNRVSADHVQTTVGMIDVWRKWLVDTGDPPVVEPRLWQRMWDVFLMCLNMSFPNDQAQVQHWQRQFETLRGDYVARTTRAFADKTRNLSLTPEPPKLARACVWSGPATDIGPASDDLRSLLGAASAACVGVRVEDVRRTETTPTPLTPVLGELAWSPLPAGKPYVQVHFGEPESSQLDPAAAVNVGRFAFGASALAAGAVDRLPAMDELWLASRLDAAALAAAGWPAAKLKVLPPAVDAELLQPGAMQGGRFTFLSVLDWDLANGWDVLVRAWCKEFRPDEAVSLTLCIFPPSGRAAEELGQAIQAVVSASGATTIAPIQVQQPDPAAFDRPALYRAAHAFVLPSRHAPWGRHALEAMAAGLPVIATACGAQADLLTPANSIPLEFQSAPIPAGAETAAKPWTDAWAEPSLAHLRASMRSLVKDRVRARALGAAAREEVVAKHSLRARSAQLGELIAGLRA